jgi:hypothetical protein
VDNQTAQPTGEETSGLLNVLDILDVSDTPFVYSESGDTNLSGDLN